MGHSVIEAINRQLAHYSYHVGQIVFLGKLIQKITTGSLYLLLKENLRSIIKLN